MEQPIPRTLQECFVQLDAMLSEEDKQKMMTTDPDDFHFTLGLWIRNNWVYTEHEGDSSIRNLFPDHHPDCISSDLIKAYIDYLKKERQRKV